MNHRGSHTFGGADDRPGIGVQERQIILIVGHGCAHGLEGFASPITDRLGPEFVPIDRACDHGMFPRHQRPPVEEVYAPWEGEGKSGKVGSALETNSHGILPGPRRLQILIAIHPFANQIERLERNLLTGLEALLDFDDRAARVSEDYLAPFEPATRPLHSHAVLAAATEHGRDWHGQGIVAFDDLDHDLSSHPRARRCCLDPAAEPRRLLFPCTLHPGTSRPGYWPSVLAQPSRSAPRGSWR